MEYWLQNLVSMEGYNTLPILNPLHWGYNGTVTQYCSNETVSLALKDGNTKTDLQHFVSQNIPELKNGAKFRLNAMLFSGYLQTMYLNGANLSKKYQVFYGREVINFSDGGVCSADWVQNTWPEKYEFDSVTGNYNKNKFIEDEKESHLDNWPRLHPRIKFLSSKELEQTHIDKRPLVLVLHGLAGGSHEPYVRSVTNELSKIDNEKFQVVVLNSRGCARSKITTRMLFTAFYTKDIEEFLIQQKKRSPERKIYAVGFSFGATLLANYLGRMGNKSLLTATSIVCNPWDMVASGQKMEMDWWSRTLFSKSICQFLARTVEVNMNELGVPEGTPLSKNPTPENPCFNNFTKSNIEKAKKLTSTSQFDNTFTAPCLGFPNAIEYYRAASSINNFSNIQVPSLIINSRDDPIVGPQSIPYNEVKTNKNTILIETDLGGHLAFLDRDDNSWSSRCISEFFSKYDEFVF